ncbi:MAG: protein-tyrosine phosphatase family protein [archaeon]|nr:protein-tyrosine phosphatase family protein [archaeon]
MADEDGSARRLDELTLQSIQQEYRSLLATKPEPEDLETASAHPNVSKNRYCNVLPLEATRVRLSSQEGLPHSDYINASLVRSECPPEPGEATYIACQAPPVGTMGDFWRMVWEQNSAVVVMLTRLLENGRPKADAYWPEEQEAAKEYGDFSVRLLRSAANSSRTIRALRVHPTGRPDSHRDIFQLHYTAWPDHGTPRCCASILELLVLMKEFARHTAAAMAAPPGPIIVQCSAGIGRTGTFIAIHQSLERLAHHGSCEIPQIVEALRKQRFGAVQTEEQYVFIYRVLEYALNYCSHLSGDAVSSSSPHDPSPSRSSRSILLDPDHLQHSESTHQQQQQQHSVSITPP